MLNEEKLEEKILFMAQIRRNSHELNLNEALKQCQQFKEKYMDKHDICDLKFYHNSLATIYSALGNVKKSIEHGKKCIRYFYDEDSKHSNIWALGYVFQQIPNMQRKAERLYGRCLAYYDLQMQRYSSYSQEYNNYKELFADCLNNIALIQDNTKAIEEAIETYKEVKGKNMNKKIDNSLESLFTIYLSQKEYKLCKEVLQQIQNTNLQKQLRKQMLNNFYLKVV
jgi:tetratricopeptide (TPR) repeat protein